MRSQTDECMIDTFKDIYQFLKTCKHEPKLYVLDNECSKAVKNFIRNNDTDIQLVEPHNHTVNAAETVIKSTKYHMIAGLQTVDPD